jgi:hypothetical protein
MSSIINNAVFAACETRVSYSDKVAALRVLLAKKGLLTDRDTITIALRPGVAQFYGIEHAAHGTTGKFVSDDKRLCVNARQELSKLTNHVLGPVAHDRVEVKVRVASTERAAYTAFLAACGGDAKRMAAVIKACKA